MRQFCIHLKVCCICNVKELAVDSAASLYHWVAVLLTPRNLNLKDVWRFEIHGSQEFHAKRLMSHFFTPSQPVDEETINKHLSVPARTHIQMLIAFYILNHIISYHLKSWKHNIMCHHQSIYPHQRSKTLGISRNRQVAQGRLHASTCTWDLICSQKTSVKTNGSSIP